jgi:serine/threonine protein phosphatase 1
MPQRTIVIGDIHGGLQALEQLLGKISLQQDDRLIFVGDYVDGWSQSAQVVEALMALEKIHECIFLRGNHDIWCEDWLRARSLPQVWLINGGASTVESYIPAAEEKRKMHLEFFSKLKYYFIDESNRLFIHAGYTSNQGPAHEPRQINCCWDRTLWELAVAANEDSGFDQENYTQRLLLFNEIFIGHTPTINWNVDMPMHRCNVWNVDTGAGFSGKLSALDADSKQVWQSEEVHWLYPGERGRNR